MKNKVSVIKAAFICVLLILLVCQTLLYLNSFESANTEQFTPQMDDAVRNESYKAEYINLLSKSLVIPNFVGFGINGKSGGFVGDSLTEAYSEVEQIVSDFIGPDSDIRSAGNAKFTDYLKGNYIYVKYRCELPASVLYYSLNKDQILDDITENGIYELIIVLEKQPYVVTRGFDGEAVLHTVRSEYYVNVNTLQSFFASLDSENYVFAFEYEADEKLDAAGFDERIYETSVIFGNDITASSAVVSASPVNLSEEMSEILSVFEMNPEKVTSYISDDGAIYFDEGHNLTIRNNKIYYSALTEDNGIPLSSLIGYDFSNNSYSFIDCVGAALVLADRLNLKTDSIFSLSVGNIKSSENSIEIGLVYSYNGITVETDTDYALEIEIEDGRITKVSSCHIVSGAYSGSSVYGGEIWAIRSGILSDSSVSDYVPCFTVQNSRLVLTMLRYSEQEGDAG